MGIQMKVREIFEKWSEQAATNPEKKGMFDDKTVVQLEAELAALRKAGPHPEDSAGYTKMKELEFAIRAKKAKGGKWAGVDTDHKDGVPTEVTESSGQDKAKSVPCDLCKGTGIDRSYNKGGDKCGKCRGTGRLEKKK